MDASFHPISARKRDVTYEVIPKIGTITLRYHAYSIDRMTRVPEIKSTTVRRMGK